MAYQYTQSGALTDEEKNKTSNRIRVTVPETGLYTKDYDAARQAAAYHGVSVSPTVLPGTGESGYYYVDSAKANRTQQAGTSGADEGLLNDSDYATVQALKSAFTDQQTQYKQAQAGGDTAAAEAAWARMNDLHAQAEDIRAGYGYSGGQDGGGYITGIGTAGVSAGSGSGSGSGYSFGSGTGYSGGLTASVEDYSSYLEQMNAALKAAALAELQAAYDKNVAALDRTAQAIPGQYQDARNQTAAVSEQGKRNFAQYAAANGLNNGAAGQAELARSIALQGELNTINTSEASALADLELQRANAEIEYNNAIAQAEATGDYQLAADLYQEKVRVQEALTELHLQQQKFALQQYQLEYQAQQDAIANQLAQDKFDFQKQQYADELALQQAKAAASGGSSGSSSGSSGSSSGSSASTKYNNGSLSYTQVKQLQAALGVPKTGYYDETTKQAADGLGAAAAYKNIIQSALVMNDANFRAAMTSIMSSVSAGQTGQAEAGLDQIWHRLSDDQKEQAENALLSAGVVYWQM